MKAIDTNFKYYRAHNSEHMRVHRESLGIAGAEFAEAMSLTDLYNTYKSHFDTEDANDGLGPGFEETKTVAQLDRERDAIITFSNHTIIYGAQLPIPAMAEAGQRLLFVANSIKGIQRRNYESETNDIVKFLAEMEKPERAADLETLHLTEVLAALKAKNTEFENVYYGRSQELLVRDTAEKTKVIRQQVDDAARAYFEAINALFQVNELITKDAEKRALMEPVIDGINALLNQLETNIARRGTDTKGETDPDNKPATDNTDGGTESPEEDTNTPPTTDGDETPDTPDPGTDTGGGNGGNNDDDEEVVG